MADSTYVSASSTWHRATSKVNVVKKSNRHFSQCVFKRLTPENDNGVDFFFLSADNVLFACRNLRDTIFDNGNYLVYAAQIEQ